MEKATYDVFQLCFLRHETQIPRRHTKQIIYYFNKYLIKSLSATCEIFFSVLFIEIFIKKTGLLRRAMTTVYRYEAKDV